MNNVKILQLSYGNYVSADDYFKLQSNWNSLREFVYSLWLDDKGIVLKIRDKINELEGKDKE